MHIHTTQTVEVEYVHEFDYYTQNQDGSWNEPVVRYHNPSHSEKVVRHRHEECQDVVYEFGHLFEGIYGYAWRNCRLVKRVITHTVETERI